MTAYYTLLGPAATPPERLRLYRSRGEPHGPEEWHPTTGTWEPASDVFVRVWLNSPHELHDLTAAEAAAAFPAAVTD